MPWASFSSTALSFALVTGWVALRAYELYDYYTRQNQALDDQEHQHNRRQRRGLQRNVMHINGGTVVFTYVAGDDEDEEEDGGMPQLPMGAGFGSDLEHNWMLYQLGLMDRDFDDSDYEMLLALDRQGNRCAMAPLQDADLESLPRHTIRSRPAPDQPAAEPSASPHSKSPRTSVSGLFKRTRSGKSAAATTAPTGFSERCAERQPCSICLEDFVEGNEVTSLPCLHQFHSACVEPWLRQSGAAASCPVCKTAVFGRR